MQAFVASSVVVVFLWPELQRGVIVVFDVCFPLLWLFSQKTSKFGALLFSLLFFLCLCLVIMAFVVCRSRLVFVVIVVFAFSWP